MSDNENKHKQFIQEAIQMSKESFEKGAFPAGSVITHKNIVVAKSISAVYPKIIYHAESNAIDQVINQAQIQLSEYILYASMQPCLMCIARAYWSGIRRIYFAVRKSAVNNVGYEGSYKLDDILNTFEPKIELVHMEEFEEEGVAIVNQWIKNNS